MDLKQIVPLPTFSGSFCYLGQQLDHVSNFEQHYAALIALRRICRAFHEAMNHETSHSANPKAISSVVQYHANQLERWKSILPPALQWDDARSALVDGELLFGSDISDKSEEAARRKYVRDVQTALLRTRYYYAQYMIYRPLMYKVLHFPKNITTDDVYGVSCCLKSCLNWPLLIVAPGKQKLLLPYLFYWSQNFLGILLVFYCTQMSPLLGSIRKGFLDEGDIQKSLDIMAASIQEMKKTDQMASWSSLVVDLL
ncbi:hypothetical protein CI102_13858 [Trichoderma harzianum]|uniref:Uncharacterized protein n=1 Tax=Trichoderma harzianum CBS 226.95 TaxID=983964 RepID=A0A2T3ZRS5_TRIHA|nr:hypothetical protein M431DRAFT_129901 [Trichoderma harzianum CBS 226.95]PKK41822.1 hypothetical protein CI102_13858 [Trichoderma harzianum]PTB47524.1 hypothetical protein M431DRAFT_129901 [Trichoderma harzianum CBS 226.95]